MSPEDTYDPEARAFARHRVLKRAHVVFNKKNSVVSGLVRNLSETGARFVVNAPVALPRELTLQFSDCREWQVEIAWQKGGMEFGLRFVHAAAR